MKNIDINQSEIIFKEKNIENRFDINEINFIRPLRTNYDFLGGNCDKSFILHLYDKSTININVPILHKKNLEETLESFYIKKPSKINGNINFNILRYEKSIPRVSRLKKNLTSGLSQLSVLILPIIMLVFLVYFGSKIPIQASITIIVAVIALIIFIIISERRRWKNSRCLISKIVSSGDILCINEDQYKKNEIEELIIEFPFTSPFYDSCPAFFDINLLIKENGKTYEYNFDFYLDDIVNIADVNGKKDVTDMAMDVYADTNDNMDIDVDKDNDMDNDTINNMVNDMDIVKDMNIFKEAVSVSDLLDDVLVTNSIDIFNHTLKSLIETYGAKIKIGSELFQ